MTTPALLVTVDLAIRGRSGAVRKHLRFGLSGDHVTAVCIDSSDGAPVTRVTRLAVAEWGAELAAVVPEHVGTDGRAGGRSLRADRRVEEVPWRLLLVERPHRLHRATGRLRAVGLAPGRRRLGWVTWVLLGDGWHALVPCASAGADEPWVRVEPRVGADLAAEVARWTAGIRP